MFLELFHFLLSFPNCLDDDASCGSKSLYNLKPVLDLQKVKFRRLSPVNSRVFVTDSLKCVRPNLFLC